MKMRSDWLAMRYRSTDRSCSRTVLRGFGGSSKNEDLLSLRRRSTLSCAAVALLAASLSGSTFSGLPLFKTMGHADLPSDLFIGKKERSAKHRAKTKEPSTRRMDDKATREASLAFERGQKRRESEQARHNCEQHCRIAELAGQRVSCRL